MTARFLMGAPGTPSYEELVGSPQQVVEDSQRIRELPRLPLWARCIWCRTFNQVGVFYWPDEPIQLDDGTTTTFTEWKLEAAKANTGGFKGRRRVFWCSFDEATTEHFADKGVM